MESRIIKCRMCGKMVQRMPMCVYEGDPTCCKSCNDEASKTE